MSGTISTTFGRVGCATGAAALVRVTATAAIVDSTASKMDRCIRRPPTLKGARIGLLYTRLRGRHETTRLHRVAGRRACGCRSVSAVAGGTEEGARAVDRHV